MSSAATKLEVPYKMKKVYKYIKGILALKKLSRAEKIAKYGNLKVH